MSSKIKQLLAEITLLTVLCAWATAALAYRAPYADTDVKITTETVPGTDLIRLRHTIHDPVRNQDVTEVSPDYNDIFNVSVITGIVSFVALTDRIHIYNSIYDPALGAWVTDISEEHTAIMSVAEGIVVSEPNWNLGNNLVLKTYDPGAGVWKVFRKSSLNLFSSVIIKDGLVAYRETWGDIWGVLKFTNIGMAIYDPRDGAWHDHEDSNNDGDLEVRIDNFLVKYNDNGGHEQKWVYDSYSRMWIKNPASNVAIPVPLFLAQPSTGPMPLTIWFTDMSILSSTVNWDFDDGSFSFSRSLRHTFNNDGTFTVYQNAGNWFVTLQSRQTITVQDVTPPTGGILINGGAPHTNSTAVTLNLNVSGADPGSKVRFANAGGEWSAWSDLTATKPWSLSTGDGMKTVYAQFKDAAGNVSPQVWNNILLDTTPPTGSIAINSGAQYATQAAVTLNLWAATDGGTPVIQTWVYNLIYSSLKNAWVPSSFPPIEEYSPQKAWTLLPGDGEKRVQVSFIDAAGNFSPGYTASIILDSTKPSGFSISLNSGAPYTNDTNAILTVSAGGQNTAGIQMAIGIWLPFPFPGQIGWGDWQPFAVTVPATLNKQFPQRYARFKDAAGNVSETVSDSIIFDQWSPTDGIVKATGGDKKVDLVWKGFSDDEFGSGIKTYKVYCSTIPFSETSRSSLIFQSLATAFTHQNLKPGKRYYYRVVAIDQVGNVSAGATAQARTKGGALPFLQQLLAD